jgi:hypothetical protein
LAICITVIYVTWRVEKMQQRRCMAAIQYASIKVGAL